MPLTGVANPGLCHCAPILFPPQQVLLASTGEFKRDQSANPEKGTDKDCTGPSPPRPLGLETICGS